MVECEFMCVQCLMVIVVKTTCIWCVFGIQIMDLECGKVLYSLLQFKTLVLSSFCLLKHYCNSLQLNPQISFYFVCVKS
jgi:hypothetical protein